MIFEVNLLLKFLAINEGKPLIILIILVEKKSIEMYSRDYLFSFNFKFNFNIKLIAIQDNHSEMLH